MICKGFGANLPDTADNIKILMDICDIMHVYDYTIEPTRIIRKHKDDISIFSERIMYDGKNHKTNRGIKKIV